MRQRGTHFQGRDSNNTYETDAADELHPRRRHGNVTTKSSNTHKPNKDFVKLTRTYLKQKKTKVKHADIHFTIPN
jgi:hypothetical protein